MAEARRADGHDGAGGAASAAQEMEVRRECVEKEVTAVTDERSVAAAYSSISRGREHVSAVASPTGKARGSASPEGGEAQAGVARGGEVDEYAAQFSAAQLKAQVAQARLEAKLAADEELLAARKLLVERRYELQERERERDEARAQCEAMQTRVAAVLEAQARARPESAKLQTLVATLDVEQATREKLREAFEVQQRALAHAQERVEALEAQVAAYQKTETVLAQSVSHLQHRFESKDHQRAAAVTRIKRELAAQQEQEVAALRDELAIARRTEQMAQEQLTQLQKELVGLRESAQQVLESQQGDATREQELLAAVARLERDKAVLQRKAEQVQKADAQLRSRVHAQSEELAVLRAQKETLQRDNKELGAIASDLMEMADRQHAEKAQHGGAEASSPSVTAATRTPQSATSSTHEEDEAFLRQRRKRLRLSLG